MRRTAGWTIVGVAVPLGVIAGLLALSLVTDQPGVFVAFLAAVPMFSATSVGVAPTATVAAAAVAAAMTTTALTYDQLETSTVPSLVGVILAAAIAVNASQARSGSAPRRQQSAPAPGTPAGLPGTPTGTPAGTVSTPDPVTGLPTRDEVLPGLTGRHLATTRVVAFLACDGLTSINAEHGHAIGDEVLFAVAGRTRYALPPHDIVARWGGDQVLLVIAADAASVAPTLELLSDKVNAHPIRTASGLVPATMSIGAAVCPPGHLVRRCRRPRRAGGARGQGTGARADHPRHHPGRRRPVVVAPLRAAVSRSPRQTADGPTGRRCRVAGRRGRPGTRSSGAGRTSWDPPRWCARSRRG